MSERGEKIKKCLCRCGLLDCEHIEGHKELDTLLADLAAAEKRIKELELQQTVDKFAIEDSGIMIVKRDKRIAALEAQVRYLQHINTNAWCYASGIEKELETLQEENQ